MRLCLCLCVCVCVGVEGCILCMCIYVRRLVIGWGKGPYDA